MQISVRPATNHDIAHLVTLYRSMEEEQIVRKSVWAMTDGLDERFDIELFHLLERDNTWLLVGEIDGVVVGFLAATIVGMLARTEGERMGTISLIYTDPEARGVGVGHQMLEAQLVIFRDLGLSYFDAPVGPGQRAAKNFFESHGFAARSIIMHHHDNKD